MTDQPQSHEHLYDVPIEDLGLSDAAIKALKNTGMTTVGDCVDFYVRLPDVLISARPSFWSVINGELGQKMKAHGYGSFVERDRE